MHLYCLRLKEMAWKHTEYQINNSDRLPVKKRWREGKEEKIERQLQSFPLPPTINVVAMKYLFKLHL